MAMDRRTLRGHGRVRRFRDGGGARTGPELARHEAVLWRRTHAAYVHQHRDAPRTGAHRQPHERPPVIQPEFLNGWWQTPVRPPFSISFEDVMTLTTFRL